MANLPTVMDGQSTQIQEKPKSQNRTRTLTLAILAIYAVCFVVFYLYRLEPYPDIWLDESEFMSLAKTYAATGIYGNYTDGKFSFVGPVVSTGPTVILPVAGMFKLFGVSIMSARLVMTMYCLLTLLAVYMLVRLLVNHWYALLAVAMFALSHGLNLQFFARSLTGEIPGLFFVFMALWLWFRREKLSLPELVGVGALFGLACITKNQYALFILPSLFAAFLLEIVWYRARGWLYFIIPGIVAGLIFFGWTYYVFYLLGSGMRDVQADIAEIRSISASAFFYIDPEINVDNLYYLFGAKTYGGLLLPSLLLGLVWALPRTKNGSRWSILALFLLSNMAFYVTSVGWPRLGIASIGVATLFVMAFLGQLGGMARLSWASVKGWLRSEPITGAQLMGLVVVSVVISSMMVSFARDIVRVLWQGSGGSIAMAAYVRENIPQDAVIETWDIEQSVLNDHHFHHPPTWLHAYNNRQLTTGEQLVREHYNFHDFNPDYIIEGSYSKKSHVYPPDRLENYDLIQTFADYDLYRRKDLAAPGE